MNADGHSSIAVVAQDAGGARALAPVVQLLMNRGVTCYPLMAGPAVDVWRSEFPNLELVPCSGEESINELQSKLKEQGASLLLSASGLYNVIEHRARLAAKDCGFKVIAVLDSWFNYTKRFEREESGNVIRSVPDLICAIDDRTRAAYLDAGYAVEQIVVTGQPDLERTIARCKIASDESQAHLRRKFEVQPDGLVMTFFSDPFFIGPDRKFYSGPGAIMKSDGSGLYGYTVEDVLPDVMRQLDCALAENGQRAQLVVRPHPSEDPSVVAELVKAFDGKYLTVELRSEGTSVDWIQLSDAVFGMMTISLLHAGLAGVPAVSYQPGLNASGEEDPCFATTFGYCLGVQDLDSLAGACKAVVSDEWKPMNGKNEYAIPVGGAAEAVVDVVERNLELIKKGSNDE